MIAGPIWSRPNSQKKATFFVRICYNNKLCEQHETEGSFMKKALILIGMLMLFAVGSIWAEDPEDKSQKTDAPAAIDTTQVTWVKYDEGLKMAKETGKHILINFTTTWCGYCKKMKKETFSDINVIKFLNENFICAVVDGDSKNELDVDGYKITESNLAKAEYRVTGYPTFWFLKSSGERIGPAPGYKPTDQFMEILYYVKNDIYADMTFDDYIKKGGRKNHSKQ